MSDTLDAALALSAKGFTIQPAHRHTHELSGGKAPIASGWQNAEKLSGADVAELWSGENPPNISVLTGARVGIFVIDVDGDEGRASMSALAARLGPPPTTYTVQTPSGGVHLYFAQPFDVHVPTNKSVLAPGIDLRGDGGQVIGPGSVAKSKKADVVGPYSVRIDAPIAEAPQAWMEAILATAVAPRAASSDVDHSPNYSSLSPEMQHSAAEYTRRAVDGEREVMIASRDWPAGRFDDRGRGWEKIQADAAYKIAELVKANWSPISEEQGFRAFTTAAPTDAGWTAQDVAAKWASQLRRATPRAMPANLGVRSDAWLTSAVPEGLAPQGAEQQPWPARSWDDFGNSERLLTMFGQTLRWVPERERWARYEAGVWRLEKDAADRLMVETIERTFGLEAHNYPTEKDSEGKSKRDKFRQWLGTQRFAGKAAAGARVARMRGVINASTRDFDQHPMLLNVSNGVVDLESGALLNHDSAYLFQQQSPVSYDASAKAPMWDSFLARVMPDPEMRDYLQRAIGYTLTGKISEQVFFIHHGVTKNGKSVFLEIVEAMMGTYSQTVPSATLMVKKFEQHPADIARMEGKRQLLLSETAQGARLDEALVKRLSGGDTVTARGMGEEFRDFKVMGTVHLVTNHLPHINHDEATMRRLALVHWAVTIPEGERDKTLASKIISRELPGVLAWAVRGALEWQRRGLQPPLSAQMDAAAYVASEDVLGTWIAEETIPDETHWSELSVLYMNYTTWCENGRMTPLNKNTFGKSLVAREVGRRQSNGRSMYQLKLRPAPITSWHQPA